MRVPLPVVLFSSLLSGCTSLLQIVDLHDQSSAGAKVAPVKDSFVGEWHTADADGYVRLWGWWSCGLRHLQVETADGARWIIDFYPDYGPPSVVKLGGPTSRRVDRW